MEARKITVVSTKTQRKSVINSSAETLAELKVDLDAAGVDYSGMTFYEGTSRTELKDDASVLPKDVPYKGNITNELVFMLTNSEKHIKSGAANRSELYQIIKNFNLKDSIMKKFGKNFTQCKTSDLSEFISGLNLNLRNTPDTTESTEDTAEQLPVEKQTKKEPKKKAEQPEYHVAEAIRILVHVLYNQDCLDENDAERVFKALDGESDCKEDEDDSSYSNGEIDDMFDFVEK